LLLPIAASVCVGFLAESIEKAVKVVLVGCFLLEFVILCSINVPSIFNAFWHFLNERFSDFFHIYTAEGALGYMILTSLSYLAIHVPLGAFGSFVGWSIRELLERPMVPVDPWAEIDVELDKLIDEVNATNVQNSVKRSLIGRLENAKMTKEQAKASHDKEKKQACKKQLNACKNIIEAFGNGVVAQIGKEVSDANIANFLEESARIRDKIDTLIASL
jgi:hypothetical protein